MHEIHLVVISVATEVGGIGVVAVEGVGVHADEDGEAGDGDDGGEHETAEPGHLAGPGSFQSVR